MTPGLQKSRSALVEKRLHCDEAVPQCHTSLRAILCDCEYDATTCFVRECKATWLSSLFEHVTNTGIGNGEVFVGLKTATDGVGTLQ